MSQIILLSELRLGNSGDLNDFDFLCKPTCSCCRYQRDNWKWNAVSQLIITSVVTFEESVCESVLCVETHPHNWSIIWKHNFNHCCHILTGTTMRFNSVKQSTRATRSRRHSQSSERETGFRGKIGHIDASLRWMNRNLSFPLCASINHIFNDNMCTLILNRPKYIKYNPHIPHGAAELSALLCWCLSPRRVGRERTGELRTGPCWSAKRAGAAKR